MTKSPLVSVLVPVYNAGDYLLEAVESIVSQTYQNLDIVIVDDGSTDGCIETLGEIDDPRLRIVSQENTGRPGALNRGLELAHGDFFLILDADDVNHTDRVERQLAALLANPDLAVVFAGIELILSDGRRLAPIFESKGREECRRAVLNFDVPAHDATGIYRMSMVRSMRFDDLRLAEGVDFVWRVCERFPAITIDECLYGHRVNHDSITHQDPTRSVAAINTAIERACSRRSWNADLYRLPLPQHYRFLKHRSLDTVVSYCVRSVVSQKQRRGFWPAFKTAIQCAALHPLDPYYYKPLLFFVLPMKVIARYRRTKANRRVSRLRNPTIA